MADSLDFQTAALTLLSRIPQAFAPDGSPERAEMQQRLHAVASTLASGAATRGRAVGKGEKLAFLVAIGAGMAVRDAAAICGHVPTAFYSHRRKDPEFRKAWEDALELSLDPVDASLFRIATVKGDPAAATMAQVRAAEIMQRTRRPSERRDIALQLAMEQKQEDGTVRRIEVRTSTPIAD